MLIGNQIGSAPIIGRRSQARQSVRLPGELILLAGVSKCTVLDLSQSGARLALDRPPQPVVECFLHCLGLKAFGTIVWQRDELCGMMFETEISEEALFTAVRISERLPEVETARQPDADSDWAPRRSLTIWTS